MLDRLRDGIYAGVAVVSEGVYELAFLCTVNSTTWIATCTSVHTDIIFLSVIFFVTLQNSIQCNLTASVHSVHTARTRVEASFIFQWCFVSYNLYWTVRTCSVRS